MATLKALIYACDLKADGTYPVKVRLTHKRRTTKISTGIFVAKSNVTKSLKIKDAQVRDAMDDIEFRWRRYINELGFHLETMTLKQIAEYLKDKEQYGGRFKLGFMEYSRGCIAAWPDSKAKNYRKSINVFERIIGEIDVNELTPAHLLRFERESLKRAPKGAGAAHLQRLKALYAMAQKEHNNPYDGQSRIPYSPFDYFQCSIKVEPAEQRAIEVAAIQRIINVKPTSFVEELVRDIWLLSFGLAGVNLADMVSWERSQFKDGVISYRRQKIKALGKRADMQIRLEPPIEAIAKKYLAESGDKLFDFQRKALSQILYVRLPSLAQKAEINDTFHFYSARHSWATIARNQLGVDMYTVNESLVHVTSELKMADVYVKRDYSHIWEVNRRVVDLFDWSNITGDNLQKEGE